MERKIKESLQRLARIDPGELQTIKYYVRWRRLRHNIAVIPFPAKVAIVHTPALFAILALMPLPIHRPILALPALWAAAYCLGFIAATFLPRRRVRVHWLS